MTVTVALPAGWEGSHASALQDGRLDGYTYQGQRFGARVAFPRTYETHGRDQIHFAANDDPLETGAGSTAIYTFVAVPPEADTPTLGRLRVSIGCNESVGTVIRDLKVHVAADPDSPTAAYTG